MRLAFEANKKAFPTRVTSPASSPSLSRLTFVFLFNQSRFSRIMRKSSSMTEQIREIKLPARLQNNRDVFERARRKKKKRTVVYRPGRSMPKKMLNVMFRRFFGMLM